MLTIIYVMLTIIYVMLRIFILIYVFFKFQHLLLLICGLS